MSGNLTRADIIASIGDDAQHLGHFLKLWLAEREQDGARRLVFTNQGAVDDLFVAAMNGFDRIGVKLDVAVHRLVGTAEEARGQLRRPCLSALRELHFTGLNDKSAIAALDALPASVRTLRLVGSRLGADDVATLVGCGALGGVSTLDLAHNQITSDGLEAIANAGDALSSLEHLNLSCQFSNKAGNKRSGGAGIEAAGVEALARSPVAGRLRSLDLRLSSVKDGLVTIAAGAFPQLAELIVGLATFSAGAALKLAVSDKVPALRFVDLSGSGLAMPFAKGVAKQRPAPSLRRLDLSQTKLADAELGAMGGPHPWTRLHLRGLRLGTAGMAALGRLAPDLEVLDLGFSGIANAEALAALALPKLQELDLVYVDLTGTAVDQLVAAAPSLPALRRLKLHFTKVPEAEVDKLRAFPSLESVEHGEPPGWGGHKHVRFDRS